MNTLVFMPDWLGDAVMAAGFLGKLAEVHPGARVHAIVREEIVGFVRMLPQVHVIHPWRQDDLASPLEARRFGRRLREQGPFDAFYCLPRAFMPAFVGLFTRSRQRVGYRGRRRAWALTRAYTRPVPMHRAAAFAHLLHELLPGASQNLQVTVPLDATSPCAGLPQGDGLLIGLNINSEAPSRRLSPERGAVVADALADAFGCTIVLVGAEAEAARAAALTEAMRHPGRVVNMAGGTTLPQLAWLLARLDAFVSVDSGSAHLANAVGTPAVVLFGAGDEAVTAPWNADRLTVLRLPGLACERCGDRTCRFGRPACLEDIPVAEIVAAVRCRPDRSRL